MSIWGVNNSEQNSIIENSEEQLKSLEPPDRNYLDLIRQLSSYFVYKYYVLLLDILVFNVICYTDFKVCNINLDQMFKVQSELPPSGFIRILSLSGLKSQKII